MSKIASDTKAPENYLGVPTSLKQNTTNILKDCLAQAMPSQENVYITAGFKCKVS